MKNLIAIGVFFLTVSSFAQNGPKWSTPVMDIPYGTELDSSVSLKIDKGFLFADLIKDSNDTRIFFHKDIQSLSKVRIVNNQTNELIAKGRGSYFFGSARFEFADGETIKIQRKKNPNGYEIIGPYGVLFKVENQGIGYAKTYSDQELLIQAFYVFDRIKETQTPTEEYNQFYSYPYTSRY